MDCIEFLHNQGYIYKNINDENILIRIRDGCEEDEYTIPFVLDIALCDLGMYIYILIKIGQDR